MHTRRELMARSAAVASMLAAAGLLPAAARTAWPKAAFETRTVAEALKALGAAAPVESKDVSLNAPEIEENGAAVQLSLSSTLPGVKRMVLLVEKNPNALAAVFELSDSVEPTLNVRTKMGQTSKVYAVAMLGDGRVYFAAREVKITIGACGN